MIIVEGTFRVRDYERAKTAMTTMLNASRAEDGCIAYAYGRDVVNENLMHVRELWRDRSSFDAHVKSDHLRAWRDVWDDLGIHSADLRLYEASAEKL